MPRKPQHVSHADTSTPEAAEATAQELEYVASLVRSGHLHICAGLEGRIGKDGWQSVSFQRKLDPSLTEQ